MMPSNNQNPPVQNDPTYVNAMSHFYRGELGRMLVWRQRLDTTTTWAITTTSTFCMVAFSFPSIPHFVFVLNMAVVAIMLWIEARRYRFYDAYRARVRILEAHFLVPIVLQNNDLLQGEWRKLMCEDLITPAYKISRLEALGRRIKRTYGFLFMIILAGWIVKIFLHAPDPIHSWSDFYRALSSGEIPGWLTAAVIVLTFFLVVSFTVYAVWKTTSEFSEFAKPKALWRI
jgi:uncharacterized membrane protein